MFGQDESDYDFTAKSSIEDLKAMAMTKLQAPEIVATHFAWFLVEQNQTSTYESQINQKTDLTKKTIQNCKVVIFAQNKLVRHKEHIELYYKDREEKLILIVGEKIQEDKARDSLIMTVKNSAELKDPCLTFEQFKRAFQLSSISLAPETLECTFIHLLKLNNRILEIEKDHFISFINRSKEKAFTYTMSGMTFPNEAELFDISDSEEPSDNLERDTELNNKSLGKTNKSDPTKHPIVSPQELAQNNITNSNTISDSRLPQQSLEPKSMNSETAHKN